MKIWWQANCAQEKQPFGLIMRVTLLFSLTALLSCVMLSNRQLTEDLAHARGVVRVGVILQRWPHYLTRPDQNFLGEDFIRLTTVFGGPWQPAVRPHPRALDVADITDMDVAQTLLQALRRRGYEPLLLSDFPEPATPRTVQDIIDNQEATHPEIDGFLFCSYAPTLFVASPESLPAGAGQRSISLTELAAQAGRRGHLIWSGKGLPQASPHTMVHAFIYVSLTLFKARTHQPLWLTADARVAGRLRPAIAECPPGPTEQDYRADPAMITRIMLNNLGCRLKHLLPEALD